MQQYIRNYIVRPDLKIDNKIFCDEPAMSPKDYQFGRKKDGLRWPVPPGKAPDIQSRLLARELDNDY